MFKRQCSSQIIQKNYSQSSSKLKQRLSHNANLQQLCIKKSLFNPDQNLLNSYVKRRQISTVQVPQVNIIQMSNNWLLLTTPRYGQNFFKKLNVGILGNAYQQLINIFSGFVALSQIYGFFRPTSEMIFIQKKITKVWINQNIFQTQPMMPLGKGKFGQKQFVVGFLTMVQSSMKQQQKITNIYTIQQTMKMLEWRKRQTRGSSSALQASKEVFFHPNQSKTSFSILQGHNSQINNEIKGCKSVPFIQSSEINLYMTTQLSSSFTIKDNILNKTKKNSTFNPLAGLVSSNKLLKTSIYQNKPLENSNQVRRTKKKFNLTSTSSTLEIFSDKYRTTLGKRSTKSPQSKPSQIKQHPISKSKYIEKESNQKSIFIEPLTILNEFEDLFEDEKKNQIQFAVQGSGQQLQRIAQEMQQILIW